MSASWLGRLGAWPVRRAGGVLAGATVVTLGCVLLLSRVRVESSLGAMLGRESPAAAALDRVMNGFEASEELLVLAGAPDSLSAAEARERLLAFGDRLAAAVHADPEASRMASGVRFRRDPSIEAFVRETIVPAGGLYLSEEGFRTLRERLTPGAMRSQLAQDEAMLSAPGPAAGHLAKTLIRDPLRLRDILAGSLPGADLAAGGGRDDEDAEISADGRSLLVHIGGAAPVSDTEFSKRFTARIGVLAEEAGGGHVGVRLAGGYAIAAATASSIRRDAIVSTVSSVALILAFFLLAYRRTATLLLLTVAPAIGIVAGFTAGALIAGAVTPLSAVAGAMLAGLGVDYAIHYHARYAAGGDGGAEDIEGACAATTRAIASPLAAACVTTMVGFGVVALGGVRMLRDFALLGGLGLLGALVGVLLVLPALLRVSGTRPVATRGGAGGGLASIIGAHPRGCIAVACAVLVGAVLAIVLTPGFAPPFEADPRVMHPSPNPALRAQDEISRLYPGMSETMLVLLSARDERSLVELAHDADSALRGEAARRSGVLGCLSIASLLPDPRRAAARMNDLRSIDAEETLRDFDRAADGSGFDSGAFEEFRGFLRRFLSPERAPTLDDLRHNPALSRLLLPSRESGAAESVMVVRVEAPRDDPGAIVGAVRSVLGGVKGATPTGLSVVGHDLETAARRDLPRFSLAAGVVVVLCVLVLFRRAVDAALAMAPVVVACLVVFGVMSALGMKLNVVNIMAMPLLAGIAVDTGIFLVAAAREARGSPGSLAERLRATSGAFIATAGTTLLGFGTLMWTHTPAIRSLGMVCALGVAASLGASFLLLMPILILRDRRGGGNA